VIGVGSIDNINYPAQNATISTGYGPITYLSFMSFTSGTYPIYAFTTDPTVQTDGCYPPSGSQPNLAGQLVIVRRGGCALEQKAQVAASLGATQMFLVNSPGGSLVYETDFPLQFAIISLNDGNYLLNQIASGASTPVTFSFSPTIIPNTATGNSISYFSSIGPTDDLYMSPSVAAVGTNIVVVLPTALGNWSIVEGTSPAAAFVSGSVALYLKAKGTNKVSQKSVKEALQFSASKLSVSDSDSTFESIASSGAGKIEIFEAINGGTVVTPTELLLNDTAYFQSFQYIVVTNKGQSQVSYQLSNVPAGTALAFQTVSGRWLM